MERKRSVVVVDDNIDTSQMVKMILEQTGHYNVNVCNRAWEAYDVIRETKPDLVLLDIRMPVEDGNDIANRIWADGELAKVKVVFMTSLVSRKDIPKDSMIGGHPFIAKPISGETLLKRVNGFFEVGTCQIRKT